MFWNGNQTIRRTLVERHRPPRLEIVRGRSQLRAHWLLLAVVMMISVSQTPDACAQVRAGSIIEIEGVASVERNGKTTLAALATAIMEGDKIQTAERATVTLGLIGRRSNRRSRAWRTDSSSNFSAGHWDRWSPRHPTVRRSSRCIRPTPSPGFVAPISRRHM
jgi:hypothetical protein